MHLEKKNSHGHQNMNVHAWTGFLYICANLNAGFVHCYHHARIEYNLTSNISSYLNIFLLKAGRMHDSNENGIEMQLFK